LGAHAITADGVYRLVRRYSGPLGFLIGAHALRATAATNALDHQADIAKVQECSATPTSRPRAPSHAAGRQSDVQGRLLRRPRGPAV